MAVRITHTNNSQGHDGTYVYRSTSPMDPQALPAPIADAPPATGATFEHIDNAALADGTYYYRTQDHEGGQVSAVSAEVSLAVGDDFTTAQIGDEIGGGIYAGTITYADSRQFYIVAGLESSEGLNLQWKINQTGTTGSSSADDGLANTQAMESAGISDHPAAAHCVSYGNDGKSDWYLPAKNEMALLYANLAGHPEFSVNVSSAEFTWTSTEDGATNAFAFRFSDGFSASGNKTNAFRARPVRRVPV